MGEKKKKHRAFSELDYVLNHKTGLNKLQRTCILYTTFPNHSGIMIEITHQRLTKPIPDQRQGGED